MRRREMREAIDDGVQVANRAYLPDLRLRNPDVVFLLHGGYQVGVYATTRFASVWRGAFRGPTAPQIAAAERRLRWRLAET